MTNMNKTNLKNMLLAGLFVLAGAAGFTACSDSDDDKGESPETPETPTEPKKQIAYDDLAYFQNSIVRVDSLGQFLERYYGEPLYENDTTNVYVGVENLAEAREIFDGIMAPDVKVTTQTPSTTDVTATLTDKDGNVQGEVYFRAGTDGTTIAEITTTAAVRHFRKVSFIPNSAWPTNVQEGKFVKGVVYPMDVRTGYTGEGAFDDHESIYETLNMVCVRAQGNGKAPLLLAIGKEKWCNGDTPYCYWIQSQLCDIINDQNAKEALKIIQADWDLFVGAFELAGGGPLLKNEWYWESMLSYTGHYAVMLSHTGEEPVEWMNELIGHDFYPLFCKTSHFYVKYNPINYVERWWDEGTKTVKEEVKTKKGYYTLTGNSDDYIINEGQWYVITDHVSLNVMHIKGTGNHLVICDGAKLSMKHLNLPEGAELTIHGGPQNTGILEVDNRDEPDDYLLVEYDDASGIGGLQDETMGTLIVQGANITAYGYARSAGIGGGDAGHGGTFIMYGGDVKAYGGEDAAGIGGGEDGKGANVTIYGGKIFASARDVSASVGAGIGGGQDAGGGTFIMYGGDVYAEGGVNAAGIGGGEDGESGNITIYGGKVRAYGGDYGAGIGSGLDASCNTICFYGGDIEAHSGLDAAAIGTGYETRTGPNIYSGHIYFYGGNVYAVSDKGHGVAIGASERATCGWIYIYGGTVTAHGNQCGPWSGGFGVYCEEHGPNHRCEYDACGWNRIVVGKCMRIWTYSWNVGQIENVNMYDDWWRFVHERPHVTIGECDHENGKYTISDCPWCHSYDKTLN
jgi:hypothetical protein